MVGSWNIDVSVGSMPEKVATAIDSLQLVGAEYEPIAYLGSQVVNGTNHAVLAEQTIITGKDTKNAVIMIFNEKPGSLDPLTLVSIERVLESGEGVGAVHVDITDLTDEAKELFDEASRGYLGCKYNPFALLGTQVTNGVDYFYACELTPVVPEPEKSVAMVKVNSITKSMVFTELLKGTSEVPTLSYAFTWLKNSANANKCGAWDVDVVLDGMPQKVATAFGKLTDMVGATYSPIAYLGSQAVYGLNHAVLAEQTLVTKVPQKNIVVIIFNEPAGGSADDLFVVSINTVVEGGTSFGGTEINVETGENINKTAMRLFESKFAGFVGSVVTPFALLATQVVRGTNYVFACESQPVIDGEAHKKAVLVIINDFIDAVQFVDLLKTPTTRSLGCPLGEWP